MKYTENHNEQSYTKNKNNKQNSKLLTNSLFNYIALLGISIIVVSSFLYLPELTILIMDYSFLIALILIMALISRYIFNESNTNNAILTFLVNKSIFLIIPLLIIFTIIVINIAISV